MTESNENGRSGNGDSNDNETIWRKGTLFSASTLSHAITCDWSPTWSLFVRLFVIGFFLLFFWSFPFRRRPLLALSVFDGRVNVWRFQFQHCVYAQRFTFIHALWPFETRRAQLPSFCQTTHKTFPMSPMQIKCVEAQNSSTDQGKRTAILYLESNGFNSFRNNYS